MQRVQFGLAHEVGMMLINFKIRNSGTYGSKPY